MDSWHEEALRAAVNRARLATACRPLAGDEEERPELHDSMWHATTLDLGVLCILAFAVGFVTAGVIFVMAFGKP